MAIRKKPSSVDRGDQAAPSKPAKARPTADRRSKSAGAAKKPSPKAAPSKPARAKRKTAGPKKAAQVGDHVAFSTVVSCTPEELWDIIATSAGLRGWRGRWQLDGRLGGLLSEEQPPEFDPTDPFEYVPVGKVTRWKPPFELALEFFDSEEEPERWLIEPQSDGHSVVKLLRSTNPHRFLPRYLKHFRGAPGDSFLTLRNSMGTVAECWAKLSAALGLDGVKVGQAVRSPRGAPSFSGVVDAVQKHSVWLRLDKPGPGLLWVLCPQIFGPAPAVRMFVYGADQVRSVERIQAKWERFFDKLFPG